MSLCNFTKLIPSNQCIGDSLRTINSNFSALDTGLCTLPAIVENKNASISTDVDGYQRSILEVSTETPVIYQTEFTYKTPNVSTVDLPFVDGTTRKSYQFPYNINSNYQPVIGTFEALSNGQGFPQITLFWMGSSNSSSTVFATNSATALPTISFNNTITALYKQDDLLYVGGSFTSVNGTETNKFAVVNLQSGPYDPFLGYCGTLAQNPLSGTSNNLGSLGTVNTITKQIVRNNSLLIIGGTFISPTLGRGLLIYNETLNVFYSFYVNGGVNDLVVDGAELFVVGEFDYINYGNTQATAVSQQRVYSNGLAKISLLRLFDSPLLSVNTTFADNVSKSFKTPTKINCVASQEGYLYIGGDFKIEKQTGDPITKNIAVFSFDGNCNEGWGYFLNKPVLTMYIDNPSSILYVGGEFTTSISFKDRYTLKKPISEENFFKRAIAFTLKIPQLPGILPLWRPRFNGAVCKFIAHDSETQSFLYAMGQFTELNDNAVGYIAAVSKATEAVTFGGSGRFLPWNLHLSSSPPKLTNALVKPTTDLLRITLYVGGNFLTVNGTKRPFLANVAGIGQDVGQKEAKFVSFDVGGQIVSQFQNYDLDFTKAVRSTAVVGPESTINKLAFPVIKDGFQGLTKNQLCRFFVRRPGNSSQIGNLPSTDDNYQSDDVYVLGWSINFDSLKDS